MPVVSQSIIRPMVPVGASTEACALRQPAFSPSLLPSCHCFVDSRTISVATVPWGRIASLAAACLRITRWCASALRA
jgi:hypothetical protein